MKTKKSDEIKDLKQQLLEMTDKIKDLEKKIDELTPKKYDIEFVSYDSPPFALCFGKLVVKINGVKHTFDGYRSYGKYRHPKFWTSGGSVTFDKDYIDHVTQKPWKLDAKKEDYPSDIWKAIPHILKVMNEHVPFGCCGGCV